MLHSRYASTTGSSPVFGRSFPEQSEPAVVVPGIVAGHDDGAGAAGGGGVGAGLAQVGVEFMSPAQTGTPIASASNIEASGFRQVFIEGLLKGCSLASQIQSDGVVQREVPGERMILA